MNGCFRAGATMIRFASHCPALASKRGAPIASVSTKVTVMQSTKAG